MVKLQSEIYKDFKIDFNRDYYQNGNGGDGLSMVKATIMRIPRSKLKHQSTYTINLFVSGMDNSLFKTKTSAFNNIKKKIKILYKKSRSSK